MNSLFTLRKNPLILMACLGLFLCHACVSAVPAPNDGQLQAKLPIERGLPTLFFDDMRPETTTVASVTIVNRGYGPLTLERARVTGPQRSELRYSTQPLPLNLAPGETTTIQLRWTPQSRRDTTIFLHLFVPNASNTNQRKEYVIRLQRRSWDPMLALSCENTKPEQPRLANFGMLSSGQRTTLECNLSNSSTTPRKILGFAFHTWGATQRHYSHSTPQTQRDPNFRWLTPAVFPLVLPPKGQQRIQLAFYAKTLWPSIQEGVFTLYTDVSANQAPRANQLWVKARIAAPDLVVVTQNPPCKRDQECRAQHPEWSCQAEADGPSRCRLPRHAQPLAVFPTAQRQGDPVETSITIRSTGISALRIDALTIDASNPDFRIINKPTLPRTLAPNTSLVVRVRYRPTGTHPRQHQLFIKSNAGGRPRIAIRLYGTSGDCDLVVSKTHLTLKGQEARETVSVTNRGQGRCRITRPRFHHQNRPFRLDIEPPDQLDLQSNQSLRLTFNFDPSKTGQSRNVLEFCEWGSVKKCYRIFVTGDDRPEGCALSWPKEIVDFEGVAPGQKRTRTLTLTNRGTKACTLTTMQLQSPYGRVFSLERAPQLPWRIDAFSSKTLSLHFQPEAARVYSAQLQFSFIDEYRRSKAAQILLRGLGTTDCLQLSHTRLSFDTTEPLCASPPQAILLRHTGNQKNCPAAIQITGLACSDGACNNAPKASYRFLEAPHIPTTLRPGSPITLRIQAIPQRSGTNDTTLTLQTSLPRQPTLSIALRQQSRQGHAYEERFRQPTRQKEDYLFVVDDSPAMREQQFLYTKNMRSLFNWLKRLNHDLHIGMISTDVSGKRFPAGCLRTFVRHARSGKSPNIDELLQRFSPGAQHSHQPQGLAALEAAMSPARRQDPNCNLGFFRDDAWLKIVVISATDDRSPKPVENYIRSIKGIKPLRALSQIRLSAIVGPPPKGCIRILSTAPSSPRYWEASRQLRGARESICNNNWGSTLSFRGFKSPHGVDHFHLKRIPEQSSLQVKVNGRLIEKSALDGWQYDATDNSLSFSGSQHPPPGATIQVRYRTHCRK